MTDRETFLALLFNAPLLPTDAMVVLSGDGKVRMTSAVALLRQGVAHSVVLSGGVDNPPHSLHALDMRKHMIEEGLAPDRIITEVTSQNTYEQARALAGIAAGTDWSSIMLVASAYHLPRAFLTVLKAMPDMCIRVLPAWAPWTQCPDGLGVTRRELLADEAEKIERYRELGHVATYAEGVAHLERWEAA